VLKTFMRAVALVSSILGGGAAHAQARSAAAILEESRAAYAALASYADRGEVRIETGSAGVPVWEEKHRFTTAFRTPRNFQFDFHKANGERLVVWCDGGDFQSWWSATHVHETYPKGKGHQAFAMSSYPTRGASLQLSPLLFSQAGLQGPLTALAEPRLEGAETLGGRRVLKLVGDVGLGYAKTGAVTSVRKTTVWIDAETHLVRQVLEDTPTNAAAGTVDRITTSFEPKANPPLDDGAFRFDVPR
jgi:outer membrane lipoprotein-sorting protein